MIFPRLCLALTALSIAAGLARAGDATDRDQAVRRMRDWTGFPARSVVAVTPEMAVAVVSRGSPGKAGRLDGVELQGEVLDDAFAEARGWRSMRLKLDIACRDGATWVRRMTVYPDHNRAGAVREAATPVGWVRPKAEAYLGQAVVALCGPAPEPPSAEEAKAPTGLRPAIMTTTVDATPPTPASPPSGGPMVQIAASPVETDAERARAGAALRLLKTNPGLVFHVDPAISAGKPVYRALVSGFSGKAAAQSWCADLRQAGGACFLR